MFILWLTAVPACCTAATSAIGRWKKLRKAVGEPIYGEKTVLAGMVQLAATGVRGLPREPLPLNLMPPPPSVDPVRQCLSCVFLQPAFTPSLRRVQDCWRARRYEATVTIDVDSQSIVRTKLCPQMPTDFSLTLRVMT